MKSQKIAAVLIAFLCTGCSESGQSQESYEKLVTDACFQVQRGQDQPDVWVDIRNEYWLEAAKLFRNASNQNENFNSYAEGLNAWATGGASSKIYDVFNFCGTKR